MRPNPERRKATRRHLPAGSRLALVTVGVLPRAALVCDASPRGLGLLTTFAPPIGSVVPVWLPGRPGEQSSLVLLEVIHAAQDQGGLHRVGLATVDDQGCRTLADFVARLCGAES